jgi:hypothetical protein
MRVISIDGNYKLPTDWKQDVSKIEFATSVTSDLILCEVTGLFISQGF